MNFKVLVIKSNLKENDAVSLIKGKYDKRSDNVISGFDGLNDQYNMKRFPH